MSRVRNEVCLLLSFYDSHDIWHYLSAVGLFISFMVRFLISWNLFKDFTLIFKSYNVYNTQYKLEIAQCRSDCVDVSEDL